MTQKYDIDTLIETFKQQHIEGEKINNEYKENWIKNYPNEPLPEYFKHDLSIAFALSEMCREIKYLQEEKASYKYVNDKLASYLDSCPKCREIHG